MIKVRSNNKVISNIKVLEHKYSLSIIHEDYISITWVLHEYYMYNKLAW